jgi:hypothetical protein
MQFQFGGPPKKLLTNAEKESGTLPGAGGACHAATVAFQASLVSAAAQRVSGAAAALLIGA